MVAEPWLLKMGNQVSNNLKHALYIENKKQVLSQRRQTIGILSFEVANLMSKIIHLHKSLTEDEIHRLKNEILKSEGVKTLVSSDEKLLLELALAEKLDELNSVACAVSRLGKKCTVPALQGFEHVYSDIVSGAIGVTKLGFLVKDMENTVRRMERYVNSTANLYAEMEVMYELESATKKFQQNQHEESRKAFEQKLIWQRQDVRNLRDASLWNQTYDKVVELLARTVCTVFVRLYAVFGDACLSGSISNVENSSSESRAGIIAPLKNHHHHHHHHHHHPCVGLPLKEGLEKEKQNSRIKEGGMVCMEDFISVRGMGPGRMLTECLSITKPSSKVDNDDRLSSEDQRSQYSEFVNEPQGSFIHAINRNPFSGNSRHQNDSVSGVSIFGPKSRLLRYAPATTVGGSGLALHYANVIIVLEKLLQYPHLVGDETRDDLYQMLPTSLRKAVRASLKSFVTNVAIYDAPVAHDWQEKLVTTLNWLAPLAHNMIRWQSERNFEQQQIVKRTNVLLLQTLYFADREKMEAAICNLLVGLTYICRYEQQQNALLDCASSFDFEDCVEWQMQVRRHSFGC